MKDGKYVIGHMKPATDDSGSGAAEQRLMLPENVEITSVALGIRDLVGKEISAALDRIEAAAAELAQRNIDVITMGGTPPVVFGGYGFDKKIIERIKKVANVPATTSQTSAVIAMNRFRAKKVALVVPWKDTINRMVIKFLEDSGFQVVSSRSAYADLKDFGILPLSVSYELSIQAVKDAPGAECIYIPCAAWPTTGNIEPLEKETRLPVVANTQSMLWGVLRLMGIKNQLDGYGRLFREF